MWGAGGVETGRAIVQGDTDKVIFIGSTGVGRAVMKDAADTLTPVTLELGGKDPFVVCGDVNLKDVVPTALRAAFQSCGQNCVAAERFIVHEHVYEEFLAQCVGIVKKMRQGDPLGVFRSPCILAAPESIASARYSDTLSGLRVEFYSGKWRSRCAVESARVLIVPGIEPCGCDHPKLPRACQRLGRISLFGNNCFIWHLKIVLHLLGHCENSLETLHAGAKVDGM